MSQFVKHNAFNLYKLSPSASTDSNWYNSEYIETKLKSGVDYYDNKEDYKNNRKGKLIIDNNRGIFVNYKGIKKTFNIKMDDTMIFFEKMDIIFNFPLKKGINKSNTILIRNSEKYIVID